MGAATVLLIKLIPISCCYCVSILMTTFPPEPQNVSMAAVQGAVRPSIPQSVVNIDKN